MTLPRVELRSADGASAVVFHQGAHVVSWKAAGTEVERLFVSERSGFAPGVAIRGGIPVIFPQFATEGPLPRHGFARTVDWEHLGNSVADGRATTSFLLEDSAATRAIWSARFRATLAVSVGGGTLELSLAIDNTGHAPFSFAAALHTYLRVRDTGLAALHGLSGTRYRESRDPPRLVLDKDAAIRVGGEIDRVYVDAPRRLELHDGEQVLAIESEGFPDVVVWNPGEKAAALADMEPGGERRMICVEAAAVQVPIQLAPGARWVGAQSLTTL